MSPITIISLRYKNNIDLRQYQALLEEFLVRIGRCLAPLVVHRGCASFNSRSSMKEPAIPFAGSSFLEM